jgi:16S rRNA (cytosine967-C5)-methyltransferase
MRRATREARPALERLADATPEEAALLHSHPEWIARMWWDELGPEEARALLARDNEPLEVAVRANTLVTTREEVRTALEEAGVAPRSADDIPEALVLGAPFDIQGAELFASGALTPQSRASMQVARSLDPQPGERVLDLCAAPGAKTTHLAALMGGEGELVAVERDPSRSAELAENCARMRCDWVEVITADAREPVPGAPFDRVLLDPPCSDLGTLQARPDARWRKSPEQIDELAALQAELLAAAAEQVRPGGALVYSTCTISPRENEGQVAGRSDLVVEEQVQLLPHREGSAGFFIARLRRAA